MELFNESGHLTDEALTALVQGQPLDELSRLEVAEHLAFCDECLQRYTERLSAQPALVPAHSCRESLWRRIRARSIRLMTSRYAAAAAAVALALTVLWSGIRLPGTQLRFPSRESSVITQRLTEWPQRWNTSINRLLSQCGDFFDQIHGPDFQAPQGGNS